MQSLVTGSNFQTHNCVLSIDEELSNCVFLILFRRIRELNENNTKKFIEERKRQAMLQSRQMKNKKKLHERQLQELVITMQQVRYC